ncbi:UNVERIFIED_CONTAM: hypothetical protein NCL1_08300 [Trichonephila clavipes]
MLILSRLKVGVEVWRGECQLEYSPYRPWLKITRSVTARPRVASPNQKQYSFKDLPGGDLTLENSKSFSLNITQTRLVGNF